MLAIITHNGTSLIDPASLKNSSSSLFPVSKSLECSANTWSADNSQLYLVNATSIKRYTPSDCLLEDLHRGSDTVTCLEMKDTSGIHQQNNPLSGQYYPDCDRLSQQAGNKVWSLDCTRSPGKVLSSLEPHKSVVTRISISNDGTLLASVSASAVLVHNLTLSSHSQLKGLPDKRPVTCCLFHQHSRTRLLLTIGRDIIIYDSMRPSSPLKTVRIPGSGDVAGIAESPFSKTLVAAVTSSGDVILVDLDKDNGILKTVNVNVPLTCCAFTTEGAAIYLGSESGKLLILDLRSLEKEPKSFTIGDGGGPIKAINVQGKNKSRPTDTTSKVRSSSAAVARLSPHRPMPSSRKPSISSVAAGAGIKSPVRVTVASKIRAGGGVTPKKKLFSPVRSPLSETKNLGFGSQLAASRSPTLSRRTKPFKLQTNKEREENRGTGAESSSPASKGLTELASARQRAKPSSSHKMNLDVERLGLGPAPESISGHLAAMRIQSDLVSNDNHGNRMKIATRRIVSESVETTTAGRRGRPTLSASKLSSKAVNGGIRMQRPQELRPTRPDNSGDHLDLSSPELPCEPVTPISLGKNGANAPLAGATSTGVAILGLTSPEATKWVRGESRKGKGKEKPIEAKTRFPQHENNKKSSGESDESGHEVAFEASLEELQDEEREQELSLQVSPRRPTAPPPSWLQSPHRPSTTNVNMAAQDFLRGIVHEVMYDLQRETKAEMTGLHLDLVRMGRAWKQELRDIMGEWSGEMQELKAENKRLKEENERLRRGY